MLRSIAPLLGILVAAYALYVEHKKAQDAEFHAFCDTEQMGSCSAVLTSEYSHILSHWGLAAPGSSLDLPNPVLGMCFYALVLLWPFADRRPVLLASAASLAFSGYLAYVLATVLRDFCIVCVTSYAVNALIFYLELTQPAAALAGAGPGPAAADKGGKKA
jgi:vitamin-K-epoxide reductase (warfarin-sensitive)